MSTAATALIHGLNPEQCTGVTTTEGPLMIIAGAGSGKTRVITHRIAHLIRSCRVDPSQILAVTFTNKAAKEMRSRVRELSGRTARGAWICTFHSMCVRILRADIDKLGYDINFSIYDDGDQAALIKEASAGFGKNAKEPSYYLTAISRAKNRRLSPEAYLEMASHPMEQEIAEVYRLYQRKLREQNALDFDDLLFLTVRLLDEHPDVLETYQNRFRYIMVDEYQDTNPIQYALIQQLARRFRNLCIVGDDAQAIYGFRGSDIANILNFQQDYPNATVIRLEQNYRSTQVILNAANAVIAKNANQMPKALWTANGEGEPIRLCQCPSDRHEAAWVLGEIQFMRRLRPYSDTAILFRTNAQSRVLEEECMKNRIPYRLVGGFKFYDRKEIKDMLCYLRLIHNPQDSLSLQRVINVPKKGVGTKALQQYAEYGNEKELPLFEALKAGKEIGVAEKTATAVETFAARVEEYHGKLQDITVIQLMEAVLKVFGYREVFKEENEKDRERLENLDELLRVGAEFDRRHGQGGLKAFLDYISLLTDLDRDDETADVVTLMTVHASKGLEFPVIFVVGLEENIFPHHRSMDDPLSLEEERRLFYVALTRAQKLLYLTYASTRLQYGQPQTCIPSVFLDEIPPELVEEMSFY